MIDRIKRLNDVLIEKWDTEEVDAKALEQYLEEVESLKNQLRDKYREYQENSMERLDVVDDQDQVNQAANKLTQKPPKSNQKKPPGISGDYTLKNFDIWKKQFGSTSYQQD